MWNRSNKKITEAIYQKLMDKEYCNIPRTIEEILCERDVRSDSQQVPDDDIPEHNNDTVLEATLIAVETGQLTPLIKEELKYSIQTRRLAEGKPELYITFDEPRRDELRPDEIEKVDRRREQNRLAAKRFRQKQKSVGDNLRRKTQRLSAENTKLRTELHRVQLENEQLRLLLRRYQNVEVTTQVSIT